MALEGAPGRSFSGYPVDLMRWSFSLALLALLSCDSGGGEPPPPDAVPNQGDVVAVTDLLVAESSGSGAIDVGDPAELLGAARQESVASVARLRSVLQRLQDVAGGREPDRRGTAAGLPYGVWTTSTSGLDLRLVATRLTDTRVRYLLQGKANGGVYRWLMTGVFVRQSPSRGGGRLLLNLSNISDLGGGSADGTVQVWWSNAQDKLVARRVLYRNVTDRSSTAPARNYGMDYLRQEGVGGRFRTLVVGDLLPNLPGNEALAVRMLWKTGEGGRGDALLVNAQNNVAVRSSECWDGSGNRTAHRNDVALDDADNPDSGDVTSCWGFPQGPAPDAPGYDTYDVDPDVDAALKAAGASDISEADAGDQTDPAG